MDYKGHTIIDNGGEQKLGFPEVRFQLVDKVAGGIPAAWPGTCTSCGQAFEAGTPLVRNPGKGWMHATCPPPSETNQAGQEVGQAEFVIPQGLPNGIWTIEGPRGHRTFRIKTILKGESEFKDRHVGKRVLELLTGPDNTANYRGLAWYNGKIGKLWKLGETNEVLVNTFAKLVERGEVLEGYTVHFARNCYICNRLLTTPESIERGIGPICDGREA